LSFLAEICVDAVESATVAQAAGAGRLELCSALAEGGVTSSTGLIEAVRDNVNIPVNVIIRPRGGDFLYSDIEFSVMRRDINKAGEAGADGIVTGILYRDGTIDVDRTALLVEYASPMSVTFHRAFNICRDPQKALEDIISAGADRILTSGQARTAIEGGAVITRTDSSSRQPDKNNAGGRY
jgi:copper homeostasis protein